MKRLIIIMIAMYSVSLKAQDGVKFETKLTWNQIKDKAKKENIYIFVDAYATWCVPCKEMSSRIFPQKKVGEFYNKNFISVAIQFDKTKFDDTRIKSWHQDAIKLKSIYNIEEYPTYLYFNPNGDLVYKIVGASARADDFLEKSKLAINPKTQYPTLKEQFEQGKRDTAFLSSLIQAAINSSDMLALPNYINFYLKKQQNLLTKQNIVYLFYGTQRTDDLGFEIFQKYPNEIDSVLGNGFANKTVNRLIFNEVVFPMVKKNAKIKNYGGGMVDYQGELYKDVNWKNIADSISKKFLVQRDGAFRFSKTMYYQWAEDWSKYSETVNEYLEKHPNNINVDELTDYAETIFQFSNDIASLNSAMKWSKFILESNGKDTVRYGVVNARLMYKTGDKKRAILELEKIVKKLGQNSGMLVDEISKMNKDEKTWF